MSHRAHAGAVLFSLLAIACDQGAEDSRKNASPATNGQQAPPMAEDFAEARDLPEYRLAWSATVTGGEPRELALAPDGQSVLTWGDDENVICTQISDGAQRWSARAPGAQDIGFSVDGSFAYAYRFTEPPLAWDSITGEPLNGWTSLELKDTALWSGPGNRFLFHSYHEGNVAWQAGAFRQTPDFSGQRFRFSADGGRLALWSIETEKYDERESARTDTLTVSVHEIPSGTVVASFNVAAKRQYDVPPLSFALDADLELAATVVEGQARVYSLRSGEIVSRFGSDVRLVGGSGKGEWATWSIRGKEVKDPEEGVMWRVQRCVELWREGKSVSLSADVPDVVELWVRPGGVLAFVKGRKLGACDAGVIETADIRFLPREGKVEEAWFGKAFQRCPLPGGDSVIWTPEGAAFGMGGLSPLLLTRTSMGFQSELPDALRRVVLTATRAVALRGTDIVTQEIDKQEVRAIPSPHGAGIDRLVMEDGALVTRCGRRSVAWSPSNGRQLSSVDRMDVTWSRGAFHDTAEKRQYAKSQNGRFVADLTGNTIVVRDMDSGQTTARFEQQDRSYIAILSDDGALLFDYWDDLVNALRPRLRTTRDGKTTATSDEKFHWNTIGRPRFSPDSRFLMFGSKPTAVYDLNLHRVSSFEVSVDLDAESEDHFLNCRFLSGGRLLNLLRNGVLQSIDLSTGAVAGSVRCFPKSDETTADSFLIGVDPRFALVTFNSRSRHRVVDLARMETCSPVIDSFLLPGGACFAGPQRIAAIETADEKPGEGTSGRPHEIRIRGLKGTPLQTIEWREVRCLRTIDGTESFAAGGGCEVRVYSAGR